MADVVPKTVKVFNLTDIVTDNLTRRGHTEQHIVIGDRMCAPGEYVEVADTPSLRATTKHLVQIGALSLDSLPPPYTAARQMKENTASKRTSSPAHLNVQETAIAADAPAQQSATAPAETEAPAPTSKKPK